MRTLLLLKMFMRNQSCSTLVIILVDGWQDKNWRSNVEASIRRLLYCEWCAFVVHNRWCTLNGWSRWGMGVWHGIIETSMTALWMVMWKMREHGGFGALRNICRLSYFLHESTVYLIAIVLMNCTQHFCFPISEVVNNDCARLPLTWDVVVTEKVHTVNTEK